MKILRLTTDWFDERIGIRSIGQTLFGRKIPAGVGWLYTLGSISLFLFILQAGTGMFLAMNYAPTPDHAYDSVRFISEVVPVGSFVRGLHVWGASAMVIIVALHMLRTFLTAAYKFPREATWVSGVLLFVLVLGFGFTGYLLPWDQKAYWATQVGLKIAEQAPLAGPSIATVLRGGDELGAQTLTRFFALHVLVLPALLVSFVAAHLFLVVRQGISAPPPRVVPTPEPDRAAERRRTLTEYQALKEAGKPFYPYSLAKDALAVFLVFIVVATLAWSRPPEVGEIADPTDANFNPRPEWYFLFLFQLLKYFPGTLESVAAVVLPSLAIVALLALPFMDRSSRRHPFHRPIAMTTVSVVAAGIVALTVAGARSPYLSAYVPEPPLVAQGHQIFRQMHCEHCHSVRGRGGVVGPDLATGIPGQDAAWISAHFRNPQEHIRGSVMPAIGLLDEEVVALTAFIAEIRGGGPYSDEAPRKFRRYCSECHRMGGRGGDKGPDLSSIGSARSRNFIHRYIEDPKSLLPSSKMSAFLEPEGPLSHAQIEDIARYLAAQRSESAPQ